LAGCDSHRNRPEIAKSFLTAKSWCNLCKRVPPKSFVQPQPFKDISLLMIETRKDSAVHVSLSSSKLVKQPGAHRSTSSKGRSLKVPPDGKSQPMTTGCYCTHPSEELHRRGNRPDPEGLGGAALSGRFISPAPDRCQHVMSTNRRIRGKESPPA
jgi:hypothetical protein